jgi:hypothetical protein
MKLGEGSALRAQLRRTIVASLLTLGLAAAAAAFAIGFNGALLHNLADPASAPRLRATALARLDESLGYGGFLRAYAPFVSTGNREGALELRRFTDDAEASLALYARAAIGESDRDFAQALRRLEAPFRRASLFASGSGAVSELTPADQLERDYAAIKRIIVAANEQADFARQSDLAGALLWAEAISIIALVAMGMLLLSLAWFMRERMIAPLARLRRAILAAAQGARGEALWGMTRRDEIGAVARVADRLRQRADLGIADAVPRAHLQLLESLAKGASRLESDLAKSAAASAQAQDRIEGASLRAAKASEAAIEAARLARAGVVKLAQNSEDLSKSVRRQSRSAIDALIGAVDQLSRTASRWESDARSEGEPDFPMSMPELGDADAAAVLDNLAGGLDALENFARERRSLREDQLVTLTAALLQAMERLNKLAHRIADSDQTIRAAE